MKTTPRRPRSDSAKAAVAASQAVAIGPIQPPAHIPLRAADKPFWEAIVTARPRDTWTDADLVLAANLARTYADIEALQASIDRDGLLVDGKVNPACELLDKMTRRSLAMGRQLMVATIATVGKAQDIHKGAALERTARQQVDDDLIPTLGTLQ
ncbi:TPA: TerS protein [Pseudomonas aeruginosa]|uniref:TerS protein n=1 Tax=Pseudomonas aeruginosa TaxID=287 RepID=UPI001AAE9310|nr:TerS protein [Pseudomonas aeruginosa]EKX9247935.1 TerS protein [Pseudomonas aeruginosa]MBO2857298.1 TerS protein [Pseudomonas aeruginosa]MBO2936681.1 TerS protein [Pseudomonas aeruginosa]MBO8395497.1 TerS protein [Pseudomonas aeruginosa]MCG7130081.1 TerS protein [Pseudomonas aeruginosa]